MPKLQIALQHAGRRQDGRAHAERQVERRPPRRARIACCSIIRWIVRFATRAASAICKITRWPTVRVRRAWPMRSRRSRKPSISGRRSCSMKSAAFCACAACASTTSSRGEQSLRTDDRGAHAIIATATGEPYVSDFSGNVTELCPVGALTSKTYRFKSRPWDNHRTTTTCTQCSVGCQMHVDARVGTIQRTMSVPEDDAISDGWLCDRGRYNVGYVNDERRLTQPLYKQDGEWMQIGWDDAIALWAKAVRERSRARAGVGRRDRRRAACSTKKRSCCSTSIARSASRISTGARAGSITRPGACAAARTSISKTRDVDRHVRPHARANWRPCSICASAKPCRTTARVLISVGDHLAGSVRRATARRDVCRCGRRHSGRAQRIALVWDGVDRRQRSDGELRGASSPAGTTVQRSSSSEQPNARGAEAVGMLPRRRRRSTRRRCSKRRATARSARSRCSASNPCCIRPTGNSPIDALRATPFVVVSELFMTETAELATLVLPACSAFEKSGTTTNLAGDVLPVVAGVPRARRRAGRRRHARRARRSARRRVARARRDRAAHRACCASQAPRLPDAASRRRSGRCRQRRCA